MPVPKKKTSQRRRDQRRSQQKLSVETASVCPQCKSPKLPHRACPKCGTYKGREVIVLELTNAEVHVVAEPGAPSRYERRAEPAARGHAADEPKG